ncbi:MAG: hypothetical protein ACREXX_07195 [Gammaproteobacteria bacterium]
MNKRHFRWIGLLLFTALLLRGCLNIYSAKPIEAWIIDAETRQPVEGAVVVARWKLVYGLEGGGRYDWVVLETVTDKNGRFTFPGWGPRVIPTSLLWQAKMEGDDPDIKFYKFGYAGVKQTQSMADKEYHRPHLDDYVWGGSSEREWYLNGETLEYKPAKGDLKLLTEELHDFDFSLNYIRGDGCEYIYIPRALHAVKNAYEILKAQPGRHIEESPLRNYDMAYVKWIRGDAETRHIQREECGITAVEAMEAAIWKHRR